MKVPFSDLAAVNAEMRTELAAAYERVMARGRFVLGEEVEAFEREWATYCEAEHCVTVGNGVDAIRLLLEANGIGKGDEVIVPSNTYVATWMAVMLAGATPVPVEPDPGSYNIDANRVESAVTDRTAAILAVHLYGRQAPMHDLREITERAAIYLFVDAAQGHGLLEHGEGAAFSFYPTKNLGALGDAGAIVTNDDIVAERIKWRRNYGQAAKNEHFVVVGNSRMDELQAAFLRAKLPMLDEWNSQRIANRDRLDDVIRSLDVYRPISCDQDVSHLYVVMPREDRVGFRAALAAEGVETMVHYPTPPHLQPACVRLGYRFGSFPIAEQMARQCVSIPCGPELTAEQMDTVCAALLRVGERIAA